MLDIFEILGPVMVGPSSSHTAGAVRIGRMGRTLLGSEPVQADIGLYGSFTETGKGHGTDRALVAGLLGMRTDDLRIPNSFELAKEQKLRFSFHTVYRGMHIPIRQCWIWWGRMARPSPCRRHPPAADASVWTVCRE